MSFVQTVAWVDEQLRLIDQTQLPDKEVFLDLSTTDELIAAIRRLSVRGAPAIGVAGAFGVALAARQANGDETEFRKNAESVRASRPTAVNLAWAVDRTLAFALNGHADDWERRAVEEAQRILDEDLDLSRRMAEHGLTVLPDPATVLTHCNTGGLATAGGGTALGVVLEAGRRGRSVSVFVDETRPLLQGARLNTWELERVGIPYQLQCDGAAASTLASGRVDVVLVGADRIAANGDAANKIGTFAVALAARHANVPFYVVAPRSTFDLSLASGTDIPIEQRPAEEVRSFRSAAAAPANARVWNPAFDVTPAEFITGWISERGVERPPFPT